MAEPHSGTFTPPDRGPDVEALRPHVTQAVQELYPGIPAIQVLRDPDRVQRVQDLAELSLAASRRGGVVADPETPQPQPPTTPLLDFSRGVVGTPALPRLDTSRSDAALGRRSVATEKLATTYEQGAREGEAGLADVAATQSSNVAERQGSKPAPLDIPPPPSSWGRVFLQPGDSILGQLQTVVMALGQMGMQAQGLRGSAIGAVAAMKGMAEGWAAGDAERVKREYTEWKANSDRLIEKHRAAREAYQDLLDEQHRTMDEKLQGIRLRADIHGNKALAEAARLGDIDAVLKHLQHQEGMELQALHFMTQMAHWNQQAAEHERNFLATEANRQAHLKLQKESGERGERRVKLMEETQGNVLKLQGEEIGLVQRLDNLQRVRDAVALLAAEKILPEGATFIDKTKAAIALQSKPGRQDIGQAVEVLRRLGTPLLVGTEVQLGMTGSTLRLKAIGEAEAGNVSGIPRAFWDEFLPAAEKSLVLRRDMVKRHLDALGRTAPSSGDYEILSTSPQ